MTNLRMSNILMKLRIRIRAFFPSKLVQEPARPVRQSKAGRKPVNLDVAEAMRLRRVVWSDRKIARKFGTAPSTVGSRLRDYKPPVAPAPSPIQQSAPADKPVAASVATKPSAPVPALPVMPPPEPLGLATIPGGSKAFFLVHGSLNQQYVANCAQPCIGIERGHNEYMELPAFRDGERGWGL